MYQVMASDCCQLPNLTEDKITMMSYISKYNSSMLPITICSNFIQEHVKNQINESKKLKFLFHCRLEQQSYSTTLSKTIFIYHSSILRSIKNNFLSRFSHNSPSIYELVKFKAAYKGVLYCAPWQNMCDQLQFAIFT